MTEAWQVRSIERNKLLEELMSIIFHLEGEAEKSVALGVASVAIKYLQSKKDSSIILGSGKHDTHVFRLFFDHILPKIKKFARAEEEADFLVVEFLGKVIEYGVSDFRSALLSLEIRNPQLIFGAPSAMTQQKLPEED